MATGQLASRPYNSFRSTKYSVNESPVFAPRFGSFNKSRVQPFRQLSNGCSRTTVLDEPPKPLTPSVIKKILQTGLKNGNKSDSSSSSNGQSHNGWEPTQTRNSTLYASTRSFTAKITNVLNNNNDNKYCIKRTTNMVHAKSPTSSGTSVESIVPKYGHDPGCSHYSTKIPFCGGSQKRSYNVEKVSRYPDTIKSNGTKKPPVVAVATTTKLQKLSTKKYKETELKENIGSYSPKFPTGLPFENEFYKRTSSTNYNSSYDNISAVNGSAFDDEFTRKPSNDSLYVDFTKPVMRKVNGKADTNNNEVRPTLNGVANGYHHHHSHHQQQQHNSKCSEYKVESIVKGYREEVREPSVVYVTVASWIPKRNQVSFKDSHLEANGNGDLMYVSPINYS